MKSHILSSLRFETGKEVRWHHSFIYICTVYMVVEIYIIFSSHCYNNYYSCMRLHSQLISTPQLNPQVIFTVIKYWLVYSQELQHLVPAVALVRAPWDSARRSSSTHTKAAAADNEVVVC